MKFGKNIPLILGISLPVLMVIFVALSIYLPGFFVKPKYDFLYSDFDSYNNKYLVKTNSLELNPNFRQEWVLFSRESKLYIHDIELNKSRQISFEDAKKLNLDSSSTSPDGFQIESGQGSEGIFPFYFYSGADYSNKYLTGNHLSKKLNLTLTNSYFNFMFLGWIIK